MALITCIDCDNQVSSSAIACPKCGAPVENIKSNLELNNITERTAECPFCMTVLSSHATVCSGCGAHKGYSVSLSGSIRNKAQHIFFLIFSLILLFVMGFAISIFIYELYNNIGFYLGIFYIVILFLSLLGIKKGPRWFQKGGP
ncbi:MAG: alkaline shock response membrane anchor protein AmaP [Proteobacteria bacterium]|nr:alkaline shock response membrane anchor protein AmaP [Pseudomonadota bacterium]